MVSGFDRKTDLAGRLVTGIVSASAGAARGVLGAYLVLMVLSAWAATGLSVDTDSSKMLSPDLPFQSRALALRDAFPDEKTAILIAVRSESPDEADAVVSDLVGRLEGAEGIESLFAPSADPFLASNGLLYLNKSDFEDRLSRISQSANLIAELRSDQSVQGFLTALDQARRLADGAGRQSDLLPIYAEAAEVFSAAARGGRRDFGWTAAFAANEGTVLRLISVRPALDYSALNPVKQAMRSVEAEIAAIDLPATVEVGVTGDPVLRADELRSVTANIGLSMGLSLILVAIVLWLALGSVGRVALGLTALLTTLVLTTGFAAVTVGSLNLISIAFIVLMVGLGIDFAIHFLAHLDEKASEAAEALPATGASIGGALMLTAGSTALAFLAFTVTDFVGMAQLGLIGGGGVLIAFFVSVTLIPAVVSLRPGLAHGRARGRVPAAGRGRAVPWLVAIFSAAACVVALNARFDADPMGLRNPDALSVITFGWLAEQPRNSPMRVVVLAKTAEDAKDIAARLKSIDGAENALWLGSLVPDEQAEKLDILDLAWPSLDHAVNGEPEALTEAVVVTPEDLADSIERESPAFATSLRAYAEGRSDEVNDAITRSLYRYFPRMNANIAALMDMDEVTLDNLPRDLTRRYLSPEGIYKIEVLPSADLRDPGARAAFVAAAQAVDSDVTGAPVQIEGASRAVALALIEALAIAFVGAGLLAWLYLRSLTGVLSILVPVALAGGICMAATVLLDMPFNYANVIVLPLMIGIGVDSGIHLAIRARQSGEVFDTSTPMATFYSALTSIAAFGTLGLSEHHGTASMGILLAIGLSATVLTTFALTPTLARLAKPVPYTKV